jgi:hypothetical protein
MAHLNTPSLRHKHTHWLDEYDGSGSVPHTMAGLALVAVLQVRLSL